ncbi:molecular chaperone [Sphingomonas gilva]|uniref:Molecular chaperone n=2 Tax=Sphingomonas gilva TaxID=2305907 RepID=A0A396RPA2_9SPHN|nr:molecular chaperone [Sphingomonas gilva]
MARFVRAAMLASAAAAAPVLAQGDLLVAPTRVVLDGERGTEVILNNIGNETAVYRVSLEVRRMTADGKLDEIAEAEASEAEKAALAMISYAPRRVELAPNQPQAIRIGVRAPEGLPDGEYRVHMLFRAIPDAKAPSAGDAPATGVSIALTPIYGVTIPVIVRQGSLRATASIAGAQLVDTPEGRGFSLDLTREGMRSTYGEIRVLKPGEAKPALQARGIAVYPEVARRNLTLPIPEEVAAKLAGPATVQYLEDGEEGGRVIAEAKVVLR